MPYSTKYNRMIADEMNRINENKADYMAYSNQVFVNGNKFMGADDLLKLPAKLRPKYAEHRQPIDYTGGITHKNGEGYSAGMKFGSKFGEDMNRNKAAYMPKRLRCESSSESSSGSDSDSDSDDYDEEEVPSLEDLLEHLAGLKMDQKTHNDVVSYLHKMEGAGRGLKGRGSVWSWIKNKANKVADIGKKAYNFAEDKIKPIAKQVVPLLKGIPVVGNTINAAKSALSKIPVVGNTIKNKAEEYGFGKKYDSDSSSGDEDYDEEEVPSLQDLLEHLAGLKMDKKTHNDVVSYLHKMEGAGRGLKGRGSVWSWIKNKANKVADVGKKAYKFAEEKVKPIAKQIVPLLKGIPIVGSTIDAAKNAVSKIPIVGNTIKNKAEEYGFGKKRAPSKWVMHCKQYAADHSIKYGDAMKSPECRAAYKKSGGAISMANAKDLPPQSELTDVIQIGKGKKGRKSKIAASNGTQFLDTNENKMLGVPARAPGYLKSTGENFEGASLGAGVMGGPSNDIINGSKITGMGAKGKGQLKDLAVKLAQQALARKAAKAAKKAATPAAPAAPAPAPAAPAAPVGGKKKGKSGSALFKQKGQFPIELKMSEPLSADQERKSDYIPADEAKVLGQGKKPRAASAWVAHVKKYASEHGISYKAAMSAAKPSYKK
jgi:hypothetical protein